MRRLGQFSPAHNLGRSPALRELILRVSGGVEPPSSCRLGVSFGNQLETFLRTCIAATCLSDSGLLRLEPAPATRPDCCGNSEKPRRVSVQRVQLHSSSVIRLRRTASSLRLLQIHVWLEKAASFNPLKRVFFSATFCCSVLGGVVIPFQSAKARLTSDCEVSISSC